MSEVVIRPGGGSVRPFDNELEHFLFLLDGKLEAKLEKSEHVMGTGDFAWISSEQAL